MHVIAIDMMYLGVQGGSELVLYIQTELPVVRLLGSESFPSILGARRLTFASFPGHEYHKLKVCPELS